MSAAFDDDFDSIVPANPVDFVREADEMVTKMLIRKAQELKIRRINQDMLLTPSERNGFSTITKANIVLDDGREVSKIHCMCGAKRGIQDFERLVLESAANATIKAIELVEQLPPSPMIVETTPVASGYAPPAVAAGPSNGPKVYRHREDKLMSETQKKKILEITKQRNLDLTNLCPKICNKHFSRLSSADAHKMIDTLINNPDSVKD